MKTVEEVKNYLVENGYEDAVVFDDGMGVSYATAFVGVSHDGRAIYDFNKMVESLMKSDGITEEEAIEWIDYNTIRSIPYGGEKAPIVLYPYEPFYDVEETEVKTEEEEN